MLVAEQGVPQAMLLRLFIRRVAGRKVNRRLVKLFKAMFEVDIKIVVARYIGTPMVGGEACLHILQRAQYRSGRLQA